MKFIDKLTANTKNGSMDFLWKYVGSDEHGRYSIQKPKYVLSGLNLHSNPKAKEIIFPNGVSMQYEESEMATLINAIIESLDRTIDTITQDYEVSSEIEEPVDEDAEEKDNESNNDGETTDTDKDDSSEE